MLTELHIENIAVIERADISFGPGLNVLCGETGSGKSIVIDSLNAVLGSRTSRELVRHGAEKALVTAVFETESALPWLEENDIPCDGEVILQRRITAEGKTASRVCGVPVTAAQLKELASRLVDIHGQNDGLRLLDEKSHLAFLDSFGQTDQALAAFQSEYARYNGILKEIRDLSMDDEEKLRLSDSLRFRIEELEKAALKEGEYDGLSARRDLLRNSEKLREALDNALALLSETDESAEPAVQNAQYYADRAARLAPELEEAAAALRQASSYLEDAGECMRDFRDSLDFSPEEYDGLESRISLLDRLSRKYSRDESGLIELLESSRTKLQDIEYSEDKIILLKKELQQQQEHCAEKARELTLLRKKAAKTLEKRIIQELQELNMPFVRFAVEFAPVDSKPGFRGDGADGVRFLMSANAGEELGRINRIASGGELSRIMLALKMSLPNTTAFRQWFLTKSIPAFPAYLPSAWRRSCIPSRRTGRSCALLIFRRLRRWLTVSILFQKTRRKDAPTHRSPSWMRKAEKKRLPVFTAVIILRRPLLPQLPNSSLRIILLKEE